MPTDADRAVLYALAEPPAGADVDGPWLSFGPVPGAAIAERLGGPDGIDPRDVRRTLDRLADEGLIRRAGPADDPRWALTDRGAAEAERLPDGFAPAPEEPREIDGNDDCEWRSLVYLG